MLIFSIELKTIELSLHFPLLSEMTVSVKDDVFVMGHNKHWNKQCLEICIIHSTTFKYHLDTCKLQR